MGQRTPVRLWAANRVNKIYMKKILLLLLASLILSGASTSSVLAQSATPTPQSDSLKNSVSTQLGAAGAQSGYGEPVDVRLTIARIVRIVLSFLGVIFLCLTLYAGFEWMTAGGNDDKVSKAKTLLQQAVIGLVIILSAYSITALAIKIALAPAPRDDAFKQYVESQGSYCVEGVSADGCP